MAQNKRRRSGPPWRPYVMVLSPREGDGAETEVVVRVRAWDVFGACEKVRLRGVSLAYRTHMTVMPAKDWTAAMRGRR